MHIYIYIYTHIHIHIYIYRQLEVYTYTFAYAMSYLYMDMIYSFWLPAYNELVASGEVTPRASHRVGDARGSVSPGSVAGNTLEKTKK